MRYVAKIHVLDVLDFITVSGYVYDADPLTGGDHESLGFAWQVPGRGEDDPFIWLFRALYEALHQATARGAESASRTAVVGGTNTISESSDNGRAVMGWTVVGGAAREEIQGPVRDSARVRGIPTRSPATRPQ